MEVIIAEVESQTEFKFAYGEDEDIKTKLDGSYIFKEEDVNDGLNELPKRTPYTILR